MQQFYAISCYIGPCCNGTGLHWALPILRITVKYNHDESKGNAKSVTAAADIVISMTVRELPRPNALGNSKPMREDVPYM